MRLDTSSNLSSRASMHRYMRETQRGTVSSNSRFQTLIYYFNSTPPTSQLAFCLGEPGAAHGHERLLPLRLSELTASKPTHLSESVGLCSDRRA